MYITNAHSSGRSHPISVEPSPVFRKRKLLCSKKYNPRPLILFHNFWICEDLQVSEFMSDIYKECAIVTFTKSVQKVYISALLHHFIIFIFR